MVSCERIDKSEGIDLDRVGNSVKCMICNYWYFSGGVTYQPYVSNGYHDFSMTVQSLSEFFILTIKNVDYRVYISGVDKKGAVFILINSDLSGKGVL